MSAQRRDHAAADQLAGLIAGRRIAMMTTLSADGRLASKPMHLVEYARDGSLWFFCRPAGGDALRLLRVNLTFSDERHARYVSISGSGEIVRDRARIHALWTPLARSWFPDGADSPELALLKVECEQVEYWRGPESRLVRGVALAAAIVSGRPIAPGEHAVIASWPKTVDA